MNPYNNLPSNAFWKPAVASKNMFDIDGLWDPKFKIQPHQNVVTYGSCFAQHIGNSLKNRGFNWLISEKPPFGLNEQNIKLYNYNIFSARTGNIYTTSLLKQWTEWSLNRADIPNESWVKDDRFYDPFRPRIEPNGFETEIEMKKSQEQAVISFGDSIKKSDYFVFTLGLTESWVNKEFNYEYPMCPGTIAGEFDPEKHVFKNQRFSEIIRNLRDTMTMMRKVNSKLKFILTVSPVPLTATKSNNHVLVATMESKSILRAVAGQLEASKPFVDYFPSYEIINSPAFKGVFFEPNQRNVNPYGVNFVMDSFFKCLTNKFGEFKKVRGKVKKQNIKDVCEEELLEAFGKK